MNGLLANPRKVHIGGLLGLVLLAGLLCAPPAVAGFEQVSPSPPAFAERPFEDPPGEALLRRTGVAVNSTGAGGVEPGTVYVSGRFGDTGVHRYDSKGDFQGRLDQHEALGVAVSQSTGCVYVLTPFAAHAISVFNADGSKELASFGEVAPPNEAMSDSPERFHQPPGDSGVAVDSAGNVYVADRALAGVESRVMVFKPESASDCEHYSYAGQGRDFAIGQKPRQLVAGKAGHIYAVTGATRSKIQEFATAEPSAPVCSFELGAGGIVGLSVDSSTGEVFFSFEADKKRGIQVLQPCDEGAEFEQDQPIVAQPKPNEPLTGLAVNPTLTWELGRPAGVLYALPASIGEVEPGYMFSPAVSHEPVVESESVANVTATSTSLKAEINPEGATTRYTFQYLTAAAYETNEENEPGELFAGATEAPVGGALLGTGQTALPAAVSVSGLSPETEYRYRVIASSIEGSDEGDAESFRTYAVQVEGPPDDRVYELVSPTRKDGGEVFPLNPSISSCEEECKPGRLFDHLPVQSAANGDGLVYEGFPFSANGAPKVDEYLSTRTASGWQTTNPTPPSYLDLPRTGYFAFNGGLTYGVFSESYRSSLSAEAPAGYQNLFLQDLGSLSVFSPLLREPPPNRPPGESLQLKYAGATEDLSHVLFAANDALTRPSPFAPEANGEDESKNNLYEWSGSQLRLVNVQPNGETIPGAAFGSGAKLSEERTDLLFQGVDFSNAISADGSHIFWSSAKSGQVYVRINGEETVEVLDKGQFVTASTDGSKVLLSDGCLYELQTESCTDLNGNEANLEGILGQSDDLSSIYFVLDPAKGTEGLTKGAGEISEGSATVTDVHSTSGAFAVGQTIEAPGIPAGTTILAVGAETLELSAAATSSKEDAALTAGVPFAAGDENDEGAKPRLSGFNLYSWQEGSLAFVATLAEEDQEDWTIAPIKRTAQASPDGRWLAFISRVPLVGVGNIGSCGSLSPGKALTGPCPEAYIFDASSGKLTCASCDPSGETPLGPAFLPTLGTISFSPLLQPRFLTDSGRLFFDTRDSLSPFDTNGNAEDVYEYEPQGVGTCTRVGGCTSLISAGQEPIDSNFLAIDPATKNVFFTTRDRLVPADRDDLIDVYDAREGGGITEEQALGECEGEACQPLPQVRGEQLPGSLGFQGPGNVHEGGRKHHRAKHHRKKRHRHSHGKRHPHRAGPTGKKGGAR
jgi:hypothetical protein